MQLATYAALCFVGICIVWVSAAETEKGFLVLYITGCTAALHAFVMRDKLAFAGILSSAFFIGACVWMTVLNTKLWITAITGGPNYMLYVAIFALFVNCMTRFAKAASTPSMPLWQKLHTMRTQVFMAIACFPLALEIYYITTVVDLLEDPKENPNHISFRQSTELERYNKTNCDIIDAADDHHDTLYDITPFTLECIGRIWERHRVNLLVMLQLYVTYALVINMPYNLSKVIAKPCAGTYVSLYAAQLFTLFVSGTLVLNRVEDWYIVDTTNAVLLTLSCILAAFRGWMQKNGKMPKSFGVHVCTVPTGKDSSLVL